MRPAGAPDGRGWLAIRPGLAWLLDSYTGVRGRGERTVQIDLLDQSLRSLLDGDLVAWRRRSPQERVTLLSEPSGVGGRASGSSRGRSGGHDAAPAISTTGLRFPSPPQPRTHRLRPSRRFRQASGPVLARLDSSGHLPSEAGTAESSTQAYLRPARANADRPPPRRWPVLWPFANLAVPVSESTRGARGGT